MSPRRANDVPAWIAAPLGNPIMASVGSMQARMTSEGFSPGAHSYNHPGDDNIRVPVRALGVCYSPALHTS
jgi:hypothetical protein